MVTTRVRMPPPELVNANPSAAANIWPQMGSSALISKDREGSCVIGSADRLVITRVHLRPDGDTVFPAIDPELWREVERSEHDPGPGDTAGFTVLVYERHATHLGRDNGGT